VERQNLSRRIEELVRRLNLPLATILRNMYDIVFRRTSYSDINWEGRISVTTRLNPVLDSIMNLSATGLNTSTAILRF
jgi:hypothetical protein